MSDFKKEKNILSELLRAREAIKRKYTLLKQERDDFEKVIGDTLKPVITPLEKLVDSKTKNSQTSHHISDTDDNRKLTFDQSSIQVNDVNDTIEAGFMNDNNNSSSTYDDFASMNDTVINSTFKSADDYLSLLDKSRSKIDNIYGVRKINGSYMIGDSEIQFDDKIVRVRDINFPKSPGLMELLFKKQPDDNLLSSTDRENYRSILEATNAHRKKHSKDESIRTSNSGKYVNIIAPMFRSTRKKKSTSGAGLIPKYKIAKKNNSSIDLVYWDDPNELIERLRLLIAERSAGNNNHINEIQSIIEELREAKYIY